MKEKEEEEEEEERQRSNKQTGYRRASASRRKQNK